MVDDVSADSASRTGTLHSLRYPMGDGTPLSPPVDTRDGERRWTGKDLYPHDPTAADVKQDSVGDCYLDATMGAVANANPQWIKDRIHFDDETGNFDVTLWDGHEWKRIDVTQADIDTDINHHGASWLDNGRPDAALWPTVLESAYAKLKYPGKDLADAIGNEVGIGQGGYAKDAMEALTGNRGTVINPENVWFTNQHIDQAISGALANHQPVTISTSSQGAPLTQSHVYVVEDVSGAGSDAMVTLRNPWETNIGTPIDTPDALVTVRLGDLIGSGLPGPLGTHPMASVNIGSLG
ncbi:C2 family cysteine protease [Mycobacterium sp. SVM_VP21]|nr:C2 family cysteine protease [Mycobacterium sp. SVM_VP21]